jgi:molybdopterin converting factor subunit 1
MNIRIRYFASLREIVGQSEEVVMVHEDGCAADVCALLLERYPRLQSVIDRCIYAVNRSYVTPETVLHDGDELVFIPPMGGGEPFKARFFSRGGVGLGVDPCAHPCSSPLVVALVKGMKGFLCDH